MWLQGQLGYGTHGRACNATPRVVDALRDRRIAAVSLSKRHSVALTTSGEVFAWGQRQVSPMRLQVAGTRDTARSAKAVRALSLAAAAATAAKWSSGRRGGSSGGAAAERGRVHFHRDNAAVVTPTVVAVAAGGAHTSMLTSTGAVLAYRSDDAAQAIQEVQGVLGGKCVVKIAAGKTRTVALTDTGEVYAWEGTTLSSGALLPCSHACKCKAQLFAFAPGFSPVSAVASMFTIWRCRQPCLRVRTCATCRAAVRCLHAMRAAGVCCRCARAEAAAGGGRSAGGAAG